MISQMKKYTQKDGRKVLKVFTKPTDRSPGGYFYMDEELATKKWYRESWTAYPWSVYGDKVSHSFARVLFMNGAGGNAGLRIVHVNGVGIDNVSSNLLTLTPSQIGHGKPSKGYFLTPDGHFCAKVVVDGNQFLGEKRKTEFEVLQDVVEMRKTHCFRLILDVTDLRDRLERYLGFDFSRNNLSARLGSPRQGEYVGYDYFSIRTGDGTEIFWTLSAQG